MMEKNLVAAAYKNILNKEIKLPPKKKEIDLRGRMNYCPTSIK